ncbi:hypothetical protein BD310DRAFT_652760 [Dichomitus squalens]|uniref:Uncharacterized protein n=1 Tax=Dichomitus squalens TaxID=114155 RepID=A0A4Q9PNK6_9APHY|nr:hypothetical protein BD310DRAFT_652760 [Dichomitus squalens]
MCSWLIRDLDLLLRSTGLRDLHRWRWMGRLLSSLRTYDRPSVGPECSDSLLSILALTFIPSACYVTSMPACTHRMIVQEYNALRCSLSPLNLVLHLARATGVVQTKFERSVTGASRRGTHIHMAEARRTARPRAEAHADRRLEARRDAARRVPAQAPCHRPKASPRRDALDANASSVSHPAFYWHTHASVKGSSTTLGRTLSVLSEPSRCGVPHALAGTQAAGV